MSAGDGAAAPAPFGPLTPDFVLAAVESAGLFCDGRLLTLNSYENRVYQVGIEDAAPLVAKFYRPGRWSDAAILEEHTFLAELDVDGWPDVVTRQAGAGTSENAPVDGHHRSAGLLRFLGFAYQAGDASADTGDA